MEDAAPSASRQWFPETPADLPTAQDLEGVTGLAFMQGILDGRFPAAPMARALGFLLAEVEEGRAVFEGIAQFAWFNPIGSLHGGWYGTLLDSAMGCAVHTKLPAGRAYTTLEYKVNLIRGARPQDGRLRAEGAAVHVGRSTATAEGRIVDAQGRLYATGTTTCLVFDLG